MIFFLKRSKSSISLKGGSSNDNNNNRRNHHNDNQSSMPPPPMPTQTQTQKSSSLRSKPQTLDVSTMPDLRFSKLDLDAHVQAIGNDWRISSGSAEDGFQQQQQNKLSVEQRKSSRLSNLFGSRSAVSSFDDDFVNNKKRTSTLTPTYNAVTPSRSSPALNNDRRMSKLGNNTTMPKSIKSVAPLAVVDKKQQKKEDKIRLQQEKEKVKKMKSQEKLMPKAPVQQKTAQVAPVQKQSLPLAPPKRPEMRRPLQSSTNVHQGQQQQQPQQQAHPHSQPHQHPPQAATMKPIKSVIPPYDPIRFPNPHVDSEPVEPEKEVDEPSSHVKVLMTTSSSEGGTGSTSTTTRGHRQSLDSNTSVDYDDASETFKDSNNTFTDHQIRIRPTRDAEHQERVQSRLSMNIDGELQKSQNEEEVTAASLTAVSPDVRPSAAAATAPTSAPDQVHRRVDSNASTFSAMLMASRPGGSADRAVDKEKQEQQQQIEQYRSAAGATTTTTTTTTTPMNTSILARSGLVKPSIENPKPMSMQDRATSLIRRVREAVPNLNLQQERTVQPELVAQGDGWSCLGVGDPHSIDSHWHSVKETIKVDRVKQTEESDEAEPEIEQVDVEVETHYNDLFELLFTSTTPDVLMHLLSFLDIHDIKAVRQTCSSIRVAIGANREMILNQYLSGIGYRTWTHVRGSATASARARQIGHSPLQVNKDPCPLSLSDLEGFIIAHDLLPEYAMVGQEFSRAPQEMDEGMARLAKATTRAHNRVLTRLRVQPAYKMPPSTPPTKKGSYSITSSPSSPNNSKSARMTNSPSTSSTAMMNRHNSYYDIRKPGLPFDLNTLTIPAVPALPKMNDSGSIGSHSPYSPSSPSMTTAPSTPSPLCDSSPLEPETKPILESPWKPGRAAHYRVWVPAKDPSGWLSDEELAECEQELYKSGIWSFLKRGDIIWDTAVGDRMNEGKYVFDGNYLRDLSYAFDVAGHLPSWLNVIKFSPSYWHNVIRSTTPQPVVYLDISPWKDQILSCLRLVQDHVDTFNGNGARYRIAKWLYRSAANVTSGQIISRMDGELEIVDDQWAGRIVIETDGTAESAKMLVNRCAGPDASEREKATLLATVMGDANEASKLSNVFDTNGGNLHQKRSNYIPRRNVEPQNAAWAIMRERCRPGLIWIRPLSDREKVF